jgi:S1-C subfamily serine protease
MRHRSAGCLILILLALLTLGVRADNAPVVLVTTTYQEYDPFLPWQKRSPSSRSGFGVVVDDSHILTTAGLVRNHTLIEIHLARSGESITATLVKADPQANLALLHIPNDAQRKQLPPPTSLADKVPLRGAVEIVQIDETSEIQRGDGHILKMLVDRLPNAPYSALQGDVLTDLNVNGQGAAVFQGSKLAGLMISYSRASRTGRMLPTMFISRFIRDAMDGDYHGFASAGFSWKPLVDPTKRAFLGMTASQGGVQVLNCLPEASANNGLKPNDVILTWDGSDVDELGYYSDADFGRLLFPHLIKGLRAPGDTVPVTIIRDRKQQDIEVLLTCRNEANDLIPEDAEGPPGAYLVDGGLLVQELTGRLLKAYGGQWQTRVDPRLAHLYLTRQFTPEQVGDRIVVLSSVLPDPINIGYQHFRNQIIQKVNGQPVRNMNEVFRIVNADGSIRSLSLRAIGVDIVLDQDTLATANKRIASQYRLSALRRESQ